MKTKAKSGVVGPTKSTYTVLISVIFIEIVCVHSDTLYVAITPHLRHAS